MSPRSFATTSPRGLDFSLPPMRLWQKSKQLGIWDPRAIDFTRDRQDWQRLDPQERDTLLRLSSLFQAGEESVTVDLLPLIMTVAEEGRLEEEIYLTAFLWEEAKHVELFRRFFDEVADDHTDLSRYHTPSYLALFGEALPAALGRLRHDRSAMAQAEASVTYNMIVEGVLAETGYQGYHASLTRHGILPGMQEAVAKVKQDESRHLAYGVYLLARLVAEHGDPVWEAIQARMALLLEPALGVIQELFASYTTMSFGLSLAEFLDFAMHQFQARMARIERARTHGIAGWMPGEEE